MCCRVGLALLKTSEDTLVALPFERLLTALNSRQFPVFSRPPAQLLNLALKFRVSRRLSASLVEYQKQLAKQQQLDDQKEQEQLLLNQQKAAEAAGQQDGHAGQTGGGNTAAEEHLVPGQGHDYWEPSSGAPSAAQPLDNGDAGLASMQMPGGSRAGELPEGPQQRGAALVQQPGSASVDHRVSPFQEVQTCEPSQTQMLRDSGAEGRPEETGALHETQHHSLKASQANGQQGKAVSNGPGQRWEGSGEDDSVISARSNPAAAASDAGSAESCDLAAIHEDAAGYQPSKQPSLLPRALSQGSLGNPRQSLGARGTPAGRNQSRDQGSKDQAKQGGSILSFFRSTSKEPESWPESRASVHLHGGAD